MNKNEINQLYQNVYLFGSCEKKKVTYLLMKSSIKFLNENQYLFHKNDTSKSLFIIIEGEIIISANNQKIVSRKKHEIIGEQGIIDNKPRSADAMANVYTKVVEIPEKIFFKCLKEDAQLSVNILHIISEKLRQSTKLRSIIFKRDTLLRNKLSKFVSPEVFNTVMNDIDSKLPLTISTRSRKLIKKVNGVVLFSDIRNFTLISEKYKLNKLKNCLNNYFSEMNNIIIKYNGNIDKFLGDGILVYFISQQNNEEDAIYCSLEMLNTINKKTFGFDNKIKIGIGIHQGEFLFGEFGSDIYLNYTIIGDVVNTASRLQDLTKKYKTSIIISENIFKQLKKNTCDKFIYIDKIQPRNKIKYLNIYKIKGK